jgi:hypothetical protein
VSNRSTRLTAISALATGLSALVLVAPAGAATTTIYLDSHNTTDAPNSFCSGSNMVPALTPPGCGSSVTAPVVLTTGATYTVTVVGAVSAWGAWPYRRCGKPEPSSEFASSPIPNRPAGDDAQFRFAVPLYLGKCTKLPKKTSYFQVDLGSGWSHPVANGEPSKPSNDNDKAGDQHPYTFTFTGEGVAPQFRFVDYHSSDNSGRFKITISG